METGKQYRVAASLGLALSLMGGMAQAELVTKVEKDIEPFDKPEAARVKGWTNKAPKTRINPDCGKRNPVFFVGEAINFKLGAAAKQYEVRDYWGNLVDKGPAGEQITVKAQDPGWYKLYIYGAETDPDFGTSIGGTTFVIFRNTPGFPPMPPKGEGYGAYPSEDQPMRGVIGMGPQRHSADAGKPDERIKALAEAFELDKKYYLPFDKDRNRKEMIAFPNGTKDSEGVKKFVVAFKDIVKYWEPRNEPNFGASGPQFLENEMKAFYAAVKEADPTAKVMGPGTVTIGPNGSGLYWIEDFLRAGGTKYIDALSFHAYNALNGDIFMSRWSMDNLQAMLEKYGIGNIEKWQTEQGFFACLYGAYQPRLQGRWSMLEMMVFDQYNLPKEQNHLWYDRSHGFWDFPTWWENDDGSMNPIAAMMRVFSEEQYGTKFVRALDFGKDGDKLFIGNVYRSKEKTVAAIMNTGAGTRSVQIKVTGPASLKLVSAFGVESQVTLQGGAATIEVPEVPVYIEMASDQDLQVAPINWGANLALQQGVTVRQVNEAGEAVVAPEIDKIHNGQYENWYYAQKEGTASWKSGEQFPVIIEMALPAAQDVSRVAIFSHVPWQGNSTLLDYELQYQRGNQWVTIDKVSQPTKVLGVYSAPLRTTVDSFFSDQWIFEHQFAPVNTQKLRLVVNKATYGGGPTVKVQEAGGQTSPPHVTLREFEVYGPAPVATVRGKLEKQHMYGSFKVLPLSLTLANPSKAAQSLELQLALPEGWQIQRQQLKPMPIELKAGEVKEQTLTLIPPAQIKAGDIPLTANLVDNKGKVIDQHTVTLSVHAPLELSALPPGTLDPASQDLPAKVTNTTKEPLEVKLTLTVESLSAQAAKPVSVTETVTLQPYEQRTVPLKATNTDLTKGMWRISRSAEAQGMVLSSEQEISIRPWMAVGPFANEFDTQFGPEKFPLDANATYKVMNAQAPQAWKQTPNDPNGFVDLTRQFDPHDNVCAYAAIVVDSPLDQRALLSTGSDDGEKVWFNGQEVVKANEARGAKPGQNRADVGLKKGRNEIVLKVTQGGGGWGFYLDLLSLNGEPLSNITWQPVKPASR